MKQSWQISPRNAGIGLLAWLAVTNILVWLVYVTDWWILKVPLFLCIVFLPGSAILRILKIVLRTSTVAVLYSFGLSVLVLMLSGLATNQLLYMIGIDRPLELTGILSVWDSITALCIGVSTCLHHRPFYLTRPSSRAALKYTITLSLLSTLLPVGAVLGAFRLNNGGDALVSEMTLCYAAGLIILVFLLRQRLTDQVLAWFIFSVGLAILLMTSMRGWDIVGHDIEREFRVYSLTHLYGHWNIGLDRSPYNACLSITILPEMFAKMLHVSGLVVFKGILQVVFATCPVVLYVLLRQYTSKLGALMGSMLFVCYPTFINDSAMLTRQAVAYVFFALALLVLSNRAQKNRYKALFLLCASGAILSHYSTAYMFVGLFSVAVACKQSIRWWQRRRNEYAPALKQGTVLSPLFAVLLLLMTFLWYTQITATSGGLTTTIHSSLINIPKLFSGDSNNKSSDTSSALFFSAHKTQADLYQSYISVSQSPKDSSSLANTLQYSPELTSDNLPLTRIGKVANSIGISSSLITGLRQNFAKALQLLALFGVSYMAYRSWKKKPDRLNLDFICLNVSGLVLLLLMVILPVLSINYGILRAFQQTLIFLTLPIVLLLAWLSQWLRGWMRTTLAASGTVLLFLLFTGFFAQILGGTSPSLTMNNKGLYYGLYYSSRADSQSFVWLKEHLPKTSSVRAANFNRAAMHDPNYPFSKAGVLPLQVNANEYAYLDNAQVRTQRFYTYYDSSPLVMTFPLNYYEQTKNQVYSTSSTRVYK